MKEQNVTAQTLDMSYLPSGNSKFFLIFFFFLDLTKQPCCPKSQRAQPRQRHTLDTQTHPLAREVPVRAHMAELLSYRLQAKIFVANFN